MKFIPHEYQRYTIDHVAADPALGLPLEMGLGWGKMVITLTTINELYFNRWAMTRYLVVTPKKVAEATRNAGAAQWDHLKHLRVIPVLGNARKHIRALNTPGDIWVINWENVPWLVDYYRNGWPFDMVVLDESGSFKNAQSKRFKALKLVHPRIRRLMEPTDTPSPNGPGDLWAQVYLLDGETRLGKTISNYWEAFFTEDRAYPGQQYRTYSPQDRANRRTREAISDICVSMKAEDYLTLPDYTEDIVPVMLDAKAKRTYDKLERDMLLWVDETTITAQSIAVLSGRLLQLCSGAVYDEGGQAVETHACKLDAFLKVAEQLHGEHTLMFCWSQYERDRLAAVLKDSGLWVQVYQSAVDEQAWSAGEVDLLLAHPASCGYGLNLQAGGHHIVWYGYSNWALGPCQQANKHLHRRGQRYPVIAHHLVVQGGMGETVVAALHDKGGTQEAPMRALKARVHDTRTSGAVPKA